MPTKKIILTGRFATPADIEAQIAREERALALDAADAKEKSSLDNVIIKTKVGHGKLVRGASAIAFEAAKRRDTKKEVFDRREKKSGTQSLKKKSQTVAAPDKLKPYSR